jgi:predicted nucleic acid-binding protein
MKLICFDTQIIIWGVRKYATVRQEINIEKAKYLIESCEKEQIKIMIPSVVVAEVLCALEPSLHNSFNQLITRKFMVMPFDTQAALYFAKLWREKKQIKDTIEISRSEMKADFMIVATALARGADCIYSEDKGLRKFAQDYIKVKPLPSFDKQISIQGLS